MKLFHYVYISVVFIMYSVRGFNLGLEVYKNTKRVVLRISAYIHSIVKYYYVLI